MRINDSLNEGKDLNEDNRGYVYLASLNGNTDLIKIGRTNNIKRRMSQHKSESGEEFTIEAISPLLANYIAGEIQILDSLVSSRTKSQEWFEVEHRSIEFEVLVNDIENLSIESKYGNIRRCKDIK